MKRAPCGRMAPVTPQQVADLIRAGIPGADVYVESDDNTHFAARVVARDFAGLRNLARHQFIYRALGEPLVGFSAAMMTHVRALKQFRFSAARNDDQRGAEKHQNERCRLAVDLPRGPPDKGRLRAQENAACGRPGRLLGRDAEDQRQNAGAGEEIRKSPDRQSRYGAILQPGKHEDRAG